MGENVLVVSFTLGVGVGVKALVFFGVGFEWVFAAMGLGLLGFGCKRFRTS